MVRASGARPALQALGAHHLGATLTVPLGVELAEEFPECRYRAIALAQQRPGDVVLAIPHDLILVQLSADILDDGARHSGTRAVPVGALLREREAQVHRVLLHRRAAGNEQCLADAREAR